MLPGRVIHADWSANPRKRWQAEAILGVDGCYTAYAPKVIGDAGLFALTLTSYASLCVLVGFDFPIGLPLAYARKVGIDDFLSVLPQFGQGDWAEFYDVAGYASQISLHRPFYPARPGGKHRSHLTDALGLSDLRRQCDLKTADRNAAAELFWTVGAQQVGKAAISGWQEILTPALQMPEYLQLAIWPFSGKFYDLLHPGWVVVCEAYPAEQYRHLGIEFPRKRGRKSGKRVQADRAANAPELLAFADEACVHLDSALRAAIENGFGSAVTGEDEFDAVVGLFGMLNVVIGRRPPGDPASREIAQIEGWILGLNSETC